MIRKKIKHIIIIFFITFFPYYVFATNQKDEFFANSCYDYVKEYLSYGGIGTEVPGLKRPKPKKEVSTTFSYWKLKNSIPNKKSCELKTSNYKYIYPELCYAGYQITIEVKYKSPWGEMKKEKYRCFLDEDGRTIKHWKTDN